MDDFRIANNSVLFVDKPAGMTSFGVVARIRRRLSEQLGKKAKVGHTGTLDPFATGLMIIVTGTECRNASTYSKLDKVYEATIRLGQTSTTGDPEGEIQDVLLAGSHDDEPASSKAFTAEPASAGAVLPAAPSIEVVQAVLRQFTGEITQTPPAFSAIKINGQRAYKLARKGEIVDMPSRTITIYSLELLDYTYPNLRIRTHVSSGTYIRSLAEDIGRALGSGAYCSQLRRTRVGETDISQAMELDDIMNR